MNIFDKIQLLEFKYLKAYTSGDEKAFKELSELENEILKYVENIKQENASLKLKLAEYKQKEELD